MDVNSDAVLACPFCGGTDVHPTRGKPEPLGTPASLTCADCHAQGPWRLETGYKPSNATAAWNRRATPASDEAVGDATGLVAEWRDEARKRKQSCVDGRHLGAISLMIRERVGETLSDCADQLEAALSARTAAPAEQGVTDAMVERACVLRFGEREWAAFSISRRHGEAIIMHSILTDAFARLAPIAPDARGVEAWRSMDSAPKDGTMLRLLVEFTEHATEDEGTGATIGANYADHSGEDRWQFAGWCWTHDHFTEGKGTPIGWLPMLARSVDGVSGDADEALRVLAAWDDFCFSHPGKYPTDEEVRQRELLHSVLCIKAVEFLRTFAPVDRRLAGAKVQETDK